MAATKRKRKAPASRAKPHNQLRRKKQPKQKAGVNNFLSKLASKNQLTMKETMLLWVALGGAPTGPKGAAVAAAVAKQENGLKTKGCNSCCCGFWQYNVIPVPSNPCSNTIKTKADAENLIKTTRCTIKTVKKSGWGPWEAHPDGGGNYGNYYTYLKEAEGILGSGNGKNSFQNQLVGFNLNPFKGGILDPDFSPFGNDELPGGNISPGDVTGGIGDGISALVDVVNAIFEPKFWLRVGKVLFGAILIFMAANALAKALMGVDLTSAIPAGRISKAIKPKKG